MKSLLVPSYLSPFAGGPARRWTPPQAAADPDRRLALTRALGRRESLGQVAALTQGNAMLEARAALWRALGRAEKSGGVRATPQHHCQLQPGARLTSDQSRVTHFGGQDWLLHGSCSMGRWVRQWTSSSVSSSAGLIFLMHRTVRVLIPPSHVFPHSDQFPINHLEEKSCTCGIFKHCRNCTG